MKFNGKLLIIGCGSVSQCAVPLVLELIELPPQNITIMDFLDNRARVKNSLAKGVRYVIDRVTRENYTQLLAKYAGPGDMIMDLAWNFECRAILVVPGQPSALCQYLRRGMGPVQRLSTQ